MDAIVFCLFAHVDHGKSTIAGHLYKNMGCISEHDFNIVKQKCQQDNALEQLYSRFSDITIEEQTKGKTHEYNVLNFTHKENNFQLINNFVIYLI